MSDTDVKNLPISLPQYLEKKYRETDKEFHKNIQNPSYCFSIWKKLYEEVIKKQPSGKRYHKGGEVHNMGISKLLLQSPLESLNFFMLGFIEDVLSTGDGFGNGPEKAPGAQNLRNIFGLRSKHFQLLRKLVSEAKTEIVVIQNPEVVLKKLDSYAEKNEIESKAKKFAPNIRPGKHNISRIPGDWGKRVFIGGDYSNLYILNWLKLLVKRAGYEPILAIEFERVGMSIHEHALLLLHNCKYAIFDVSTKGGHLMEIERAFYDYNTKAIFICLEESFSTLSGMLDDLKPKPFSFKGLDELKEIMKVFFKNLQ